MITALKEFKNSFYEALDINQATLSGCRDIVCVIQEDGTIKSSSFHVRFGKLRVLRPKEKLVTLTINGVVQDLKMKLGRSGEGYFEEERVKQEKKVNLFNKKIAAAENNSPEITPLNFSDDNLSDLEIQSGSASEDENDKKNNNDDKKTTVKINKEVINVDKKGKIDKTNEKSGWRLWGLFNRDKKSENTEIANNPGNINPTQIINSENLPTSMPDIIVQKPSESIKIEVTSVNSQINIENKQEGNQLDVLKVQYETNKLEVKSEHASRKNSTVAMEEPNNIKNIPQNKEKKGIITWFSEKFSKEKKDNKSNLVEDEENKIAAKENEEKVNSNINKDNAAVNKNIINADNKDIINNNKEVQFVKDNTSNITVEKNNDNIDDIKEMMIMNLAETNSNNQEKNVIRDDIATPVKIEIINDNNNINQKEIKPIITDQMAQKEKVEDLENLNEQAEEIIGSTDLLEEAEEENVVELSICAHLITQKNEEDLTEIFNANKVREEEYFKDPLKVLANPNLMVKIEDHLYEWKIAEPLIISKLVFHQDLPESVLKEVIRNKKGSSWKMFNWFSRGKTKKASVKPSIDGNTGKPSPKESPKKENSLEKKLAKEAAINKQKNANIRKSLKPHSNILKSFNLKIGKNTIVYSITTEYQGTSSLEAYIYLWNNNTKIVISDIDGTITKSDVLGQLMPMVGKKWCHEGVTKFLQNIKKNGYQILYLTARAIGQAQQTKNFLNSVLLDDMRLPEGPVFMSPDRLLESFQREIIYKKPELFKIACLREIKSIFHQQEGLYAGFGNKDTDAIAYRSVGVTMGKIFIINESSQIHQLNNTYLKSYPELNEMADLIFPPLNENTIIPPEEYNDLNYWKIKIDTNVDFSKWL